MDFFVRIEDGFFDVRDIIAVYPVEDDEDPLVKSEIFMRYGMEYSFYLSVSEVMALIELHCDTYGIVRV